MNLPYDPFFTHCPVIAKCVTNTTGPILELGTGVYSTAFLSFLACPRKIVSMDTDLNWLAKLKTHFEADNHEFVHVDCDNDATKYSRFMDDFAKQHPDPWALVFIDHGLLSERRTDIERFKDNSELIIVHDSSYTANSGHDDKTYRYNSFINEFKYKYEYTKFWPYTCVMSNSNDLAWI